KAKKRKGEPPMLIRELLLPEFDEEMAKTRKVLAALQDDKLDFKPHEKSWSMKSLATHVSQIPSWILETLRKNELDIAPPGAPPCRAPELNSLKAFLDALEDHVASARAALATATDEQLLEPWSLLMGGNNIFTMPRYNVIRGMVMNHLIHHRAQ